MRRGALAVLLLLVTAGAAGAQPYRRTGAPRHGSLEVGGGAVWIGGVDFGERRAEEQRNPTTGTDPLVLFVTTNRIDSIAGLQARVGFYITPRFVLEAGLRYSRPVLATRITGDFEQAADAVVKETLAEYVFDGSLVVHLAELADGRVVPFVQGGAGHIRDLHDGAELVQTGTEYHGGGGVKLWLGSGQHRFGVRGEVAASSRTGGFDFSTKRRTIPTASASLMYVF